MRHPVLVDDGRKIISLFAIKVHYKFQCQISREPKTYYCFMIYPKKNLNLGYTNIVQEISYHCRVADLALPSLNLAYSQKVFPSS